MPREAAVWQGYDGVHYQIYRLDPKTGEIDNLSQNSYDNRYPRINAKGQVVWESDENFHISAIYLWDPKIGGVGVDISTNFPESASPQINAKGLVVWVGWDGTHNQIFLRSPKTGVIEKISESLNCQTFSPRLMPRARRCGWLISAGRTAIYCPVGLQEGAATSPTAGTVAPSPKSMPRAWWSGESVGSANQIYRWDPKAQTPTNISNNSLPIIRSPRSTRKAMWSGSFWTAPSGWFIWTASRLALRAHY